MKETFYKLTNSADVPTAPSGNRNLIIKSTAQTGSRLGIDAILINDSNHMLTDWIKIEPNKTYTLTTYEDVTETNMWYSLAWYSTNNSDYSGWISRPTGAATAANLKGGKQYTSPANATYAKVSYPKNYSKIKLERGSAATSYSAAPEDFGWSPTALVPTQEQRYLWKFEYAYYSDGSVEVTQPVNLSIAGQNGAQGPKGDSTGIAISDTEPSTKYVNMLWKHTGNVSGLITGATYRWTGSKWELYLFTAANITTENLAAITANLGTVTAGTVKGTTIEMSLDDNQIAIGTNNRTPNTIDATEGLVVYGTNGYSSAISSQGTVYELSSGSTLYQMWMEPSGLRFVYYISSSNNGVRYFNATSNGFEFKPTSDATGIGGNTGIDLKGQVTYVDFHWEIETTADYRTRLQQENGKFTIDSPYSNLLLKGGGEVRILTPGVNVRNYTDSAWAPVNASGFGQQSDSQYKYNIKDMPDRLNELMGLEFKAYRLWGEDGKYQEGLLADKNYQQPFVNRGKDGDYNIDMYGYTTFLAKSLQEAVKRLEILENASRNGQSSGTTIDTSETTVAGERNAESS